LYDEWSKEIIYEALIKEDPFNQALQSTA